MDSFWKVKSEASALVGVIEARLNAEADTSDQWAKIAYQAHLLELLCNKRAKQLFRSEKAGVK